MLFFLFGNLDYGMILRFIIIVVDKGFLFLIGIIYVDIIYKEVIIMIIIIIVVFFIYNFWDDSGVVVVFFIVMVLGYFLILLRFCDNKIIFIDCFYGIVRFNEINVIFFFLGIILFVVLLYYLLRCCFMGMCCGLELCDFMECCRSYERLW